METQETGFLLAGLETAFDMKYLVRFFLSLLVLLALASCEPRGQLTTISPSSSLPEDATTHEIFVGTTRARSEDGQVFGPERGQETSFARFTVSVPPTHQTGQIEWPPEGVPDPAEHFVVQSGSLFSDRTTFQRKLAGAMSQSPTQDQATIFVHGYNMNFAETLYLMAQAHHDFENQDVPILFTWPSAATTVGYLYDRDSTILARDHLVEFIRTVRQAGPNEVLLIAHSMGSFLLMESLRQIALTDDRNLLNAISGVILMSPDIDLQVFESQAKAIGTLPQPFVIFSSQADRALKVSRSLARDERLGAIDSVARLEDLQVTVVDVTALSEPGSLNHLTTITSPEFIELILQLEPLKQSLDSDFAVEQEMTLVDFFNQAKEVTIAPFRN
ncbi:MAG: alpha/beta fold hydrolase [Dinoroseobacter sp.]|nr:alpha/beta fold hydrolase [Dinoroseobacter sp.]